MIQLASPAEGMGDGEHEEFGERDTLLQTRPGAGLARHSRIWF